MNVGGQMLTILRAIGAQATESGRGASYAQISEATGINQHLLMSKASRLKARGLIERSNPEAPRCAHAFFQLTAKGRSALHPVVAEPEIAISTVQRAILRRPALAIVWASA